MANSSDPLFHRLAAGHVPLRNRFPGYGCFGNSRHNAATELSAGRVTLA
jgi:hypothetical protein